MKLYSESRTRVGSVAENQGSPHHAWELHRERRKLIGSVLYDALGLVLQLEDNRVYS